MMTKIDSPITASMDTLDRVLGSGLPAVLVLYNTKNGDLSDPMQQTMKRIAKNEAQRLLIVKSDVAENPSLGLKFDLSGGTPVMIAMKDQKEVARQNAATPGTLENYAAYLLGRSDKINQNGGNNKPSSAKPVKVSDRDFAERVLGSDRPVLVDFWAEWCGPCHMIAPSLEKLAGEFGDQLTVAKLNVDENPQMARQYRVQGIPMLLIFKNGQVIDRLVGAAPEPTLRQFVQQHI
jgi:thioredoxin 1